MNKRLWIVGMLGFSSGLPLALLTGTLQAWCLDRGWSVIEVSIFHLLGLCYHYRFLWAPLLDRYFIPKLGRRRTWMLCTQLLLCVGFNILALESPLDHPSVFTYTVICLLLISATQDIAIDAQRIEYLSPQNQALGASFSVLGARIALFFSGSLSLIVAPYLGWHAMYHWMSLGFIIGLWATLSSKEPSLDVMNTLSPTLKATWLAPLQALYHRPHIGMIILFILFYKLGESFVSSTSGLIIPFLMNGLHLSIETIGYVNKGIGMIAMILGSLLSGCLLKRHSLLSCLRYFGLAHTLSIGLFIWISAHTVTLSEICMTIFIENFTSGLASIALITLLMRLVDQRFTATQFSILIACATLPRVFSPVLGAFIQTYCGWTVLYCIVWILSLLFIPFLQRMKAEEIYA